MDFPPQIAAFWQTYLSTCPDSTQPKLDPEPVWRFGSTDEDATSVGQLVKQGIKIATSGLLWEMEHDRLPLSQVGDLAIVADGAEEPLCIIELTEVVVKPFNEVDQQFAVDYGEYGRTLAQWRVASWAFFSDCCADIGREPSESMPMICQRFRRVYPD